MPGFFLIADDSTSKAMMLRGIVERARLDLEIVEARTTEQAKFLADSKQPMVAAFIDFEMPSELGPAVIEHLRNVQPEALIACVSSAGSSSYREAAAAAGANTYVCTTEGNVNTVLSDLLLEWKVELGPSTSSG